MNEPISLQPIGVFRAKQTKKYDLPRQPSDEGLNGKISLFPHRNFEQALEGLEDFERIWVFFLFHESLGWRPKVLPTRSSKKIGLFATRAPHRPCPIGMSSVALEAIEGRNLFVQGADLLDGTPILDIKPYIPYCDSFPSAKAGWVDSIHNGGYEVIFSEIAADQRAYLESLGVAFRNNNLDALKYFSAPTHYNRVTKLDADRWVFACKDWRFVFRLDLQTHTAVIEQIASGYDIDLIDIESLCFMHRAFLKRYPHSWMSKGKKI